MRILILTQWFQPEPFLKGLCFAKELRNQGHDVHVLTGYPNYPSGKLYPGYTIKGVLRETMDGVPITRVPLYPSHNKSKIARAANYLSFAFCAMVVGVFMRFKPDVIYAYHPPLTVDIAGCLIGFFRRVPVVVDVLDLWPDTLAASGILKNRTLLKTIGWLAQRIYRQAAAIVVPTEGYYKKFLTRGVPQKKLHLIHNWCDEEALAQRSLSQPGLLASFKGRFTVVYAGNMGPAQALFRVLDAAALLKKKRDDIQFVFVGDGLDSTALKKDASARQLSNVSFFPQMPMNEVGHVLDAADALLVHLRVDPLFTITIPSKTQAYLFAGKPIVMAVAGDAKSLILRAQAGVCAVPEDPHSLVQAVESLADLSESERVAMGKRGRLYYDENLSLKIGTRLMAAVFASCVKRGR
ncbi:MAG: glycosyltransferase family 4 protein [Alphaproteobacteria bacterium]|nr:glycosyltransferase family 4 protein [Alphaproteobacteria bacterium]